MGCGESKEEYRDIDFTPEQIQRIKSIFDELISQNPKTKGKDYLLKENFSAFFSENPKFGRQLYKFILLFTGKTVMNFRVFLKGAELLCRDKQLYSLGLIDHQQFHEKFDSSVNIVNKSVNQSQNPDESEQKHNHIEVVKEEHIHVYSNTVKQDPKLQEMLKIQSLNKVDLFFMITNKKSYIEYTKQNYSSRNLQIGYQQALKFVINILKIFNFNSTESKISEKGAKSLVDTIFRSEFGQVDYWTFLLVIKEQLFYLNNVLKYYFETKFQKFSVKYHLPQLDQPSQLLSKEIISLIYLSNTYMQSSHEMKMIFSSSTETFDFQALTQKLFDFQGPCIILIQAKQKNNNIADDDKKRWVFGAFNTKFQKDKEGLQGNEECYIFSISPKFQIYFTNNKSKKESQQNYVFANTKGYSNKGIGFGGQVGKHRIWIDQDIQNGSYTHFEGQTYQKGYLTDPKIDIKITNIEVWGMSKNPNRKAENILPQQQQIIKNHLNQYSSIIRKSYVQEVYNTSKPEQIIANNQRATYNEQDGQNSLSYISQSNKYDNNSKKFDNVDDYLQNYTQPQYSSQKHSYQQPYQPFQLSQNSQINQSYQEILINSPQQQ